MPARKSDFSLPDRLTLNNSTFGLAGPLIVRHGAKRYMKRHILFFLFYIFAVINVFLPALVSR